MESNGWGDMTTLRLLGEGLNDAKQKRISTGNRVARAHIAIDVFGTQMLTAALEEEKRYGRWLTEEYARVVPERVRLWAASVPGIAKSELFPRIISMIGNPCIATPMAWGEVEGVKTIVPAGEPYARGVRQLWSYCGCGDPARRPFEHMTQKDLLACGKRTVVRPLLNVWSTTLIKATGRSEKARNSGFYQLYLRSKEEGATKVHQRECRNHKLRNPDGCGTVAHPEWGAIGSPWRPGHVNMHGHRMMHKEFLRQLWEVSANVVQTSRGTHHGNGPS